MTFGSLFTGIGGLDLGLERAGMSCRWQVEIDPYARRVLERHWPSVQRWDDVRTFPPPGWDGQVDLICGGFPCQDISDAGSRSGINGERSGLWSEFFRIVCLVRPRYVLVENVAALSRRGLGRVLGDLAFLGCDAEWGVLSSCRMGAPHTRERMFVISYPSGKRWNKGRGAEIHEGQQKTPLDLERRAGRKAESTVQRVAHRVPDRMERLKGIGNAVDPDVAEWIGRRILEIERVTS